MVVTNTEPEKQIQDIPNSDESEISGSGIDGSHINDSHIE